MNKYAVVPTVQNSVSVFAFAAFGINASINRSNYEIRKGESLVR
jgi:hypothetical protein